MYCISVLSVLDRKTLYHCLKKGMEKG